MSSIQQMLHWMERIGKLQHGVAVPFGADVSKMNEDDKLWQPWTSEERKYFKGMRNLFAHARHSVLGNGDVRMKDKHPTRRTGKPDIHGLQFDKETTEWEWTAQEFQEFSQRLETLVLQRIQAYTTTTVTCQTCGLSVDGREYLTCGHVEYGEDSGGSVLIRKPKGGTAKITFTIGCDDNMKDRRVAAGSKAVITHEGFDKFLSSMEFFDEEATKAEKEGTPLYVVQPD